ncbi:Gmad2 immunoglobulin-like domain-containing protein [Mesonia sp. K7]|uniref:Gmad2 immunoglobulin-like domain-containing protein n=1 Tax=Mesonia sp. K7 TaxID=2218606 RepID=UPI000DA9E86F|nr:Gmad2 immunoglobulin-like domain-containing protein [Mesonia sp. K7]PZD78064.1 hypothetical protein DNG35_06730 [Mesonia sp. K7]
MKKLAILLSLTLFCACQETKKETIDKSNSSKSDSTFVKTGPEEKPGKKTIRDTIIVDFPQSNQEVKSPITIKGKAKGYWFFEADAPVQLVDEKGGVISEKYIQTTENWMTTDWVPFEGDLSYEVISKQRAFLVFKKANPSGFSKHDQSDTIPVILK